jgi:hypothetical protein
MILSNLSYLPVVDDNGDDDAAAIVAAAFRADEDRPAAPAPPAAAVPGGMGGFCCGPPFPLTLPPAPLPPPRLKSPGVVNAAPELNADVNNKDTDTVHTEAKSVTRVATIDATFVVDAVDPFDDDEDDDDEWH